MTARHKGDDKRAAARGSVQEAIGKLIGDDAARDRGAAERKAAEHRANERSAGADDSPADGKSPRR